MSATVLEAPASADNQAGFTLEVYSKPDCVQCTAMHRKVGKLCIDYVNAKLDDDADRNTDAVREFGMSLGVASAPLCVVRNAEGTIVDSWGGFNPGRVDEWAPVLPTVAEAAQAA